MHTLPWRKTLILVLLLPLLWAGGACKRAKHPEHVEPPAAARRTLLTLYPRAPADSTRWEWDRDGYFEAHFRLDGLPHKFRTDTTGRYLETEINVARRALPPAVQDTLQADADRLRNPRLYRVRSVSIVHYADGHTEYEAHVRTNGKWRKRYYDEKGNLLREEKANQG